MSDPVATSTRTYARDRIVGWRPEIRHPEPGPGESLPPGPRSPAAVQSLRVWGARNTYFPAVQSRLGDTFQLQITPIGRVVIVCGLEDVRKVTLGGPELFPIGEGNSMFEALIGKRTVLSIDGAEHRSERKRMMPAFHGDRIARLGTSMEELVAEEVATWPVGRAFPLVPAMQRLALRVILRAVLGVEDPDRAAELAPALRRMVEYSNVELLMLIWPKLIRYGPWRRVIADLDRADDLLIAEIHRRRADPDRQQRPDVLSMLLDGEPDDELVRVELVTLLAGGQDTSAMAVSWMFERLLRHPQALARVREGLDTSDDPYRTAVINETMRVRPIVYNVGRRTSAPVELGGHLVPAGTFVWASLAAIHRDKRIWGEDAHEFRPERWSEPDVPRRAFLPWGGGAHRCLGAVLAYLEMEVILRTVLRHVELRADRPEDETMVMRNIFALPKRGARVVVERRIGG